MFPPRRNLQRFQSHAGSIEAVSGSTILSVIPGFNPTLVRLRLTKKIASSFFVTRFNPTLVRLRRQPHAPATDMNTGFQSHAGSIEAGTDGVTGVSGDLRFNPTLVRLRHPLNNAVKNASHEFQSHAGSIEARWTSSPPGGSSPFQSHAGSIEAGRRAWLERSDTKVSIPRWFD